MRIVKATGSIHRALRTEVETFFFHVVSAAVTRSSFFLFCTDSVVLLFSNGAVGFDLIELRGLKRKRGCGMSE